MGGCLRPENNSGRPEEKTHDVTFGLLPCFKLFCFLGERLGKYMLCVIILFCVCLHCINNGLWQDLYMFCDAEFNSEEFSCATTINKAFG